MKNLHWIDIETTGLDEKADGAKILEVALVTTTPQLKEVHRVAMVVAHELPDEEIETWHANVQRMHIRNGLISDCREAVLTLDDVDKCLAFAIEQNGKGGMIAGQSVHFDKRWIKHHMPETDKVLHSYHIVDARTTLTMLEAWTPFRAKDLGRPYNHRAECDIDWTLGVMQYAKEMHFNEEE